MTNAMQVFSNEDFNEIRVVGTPDNPLFCLADVCKALGINTNLEVRRLKKYNKEVVSTYPVQTEFFGIKKFYFVNEDGLFDVILNSREPEAEKFCKWIESEVLPSIRKTGKYTLPHRVDEVKPSQMVMEIDAMSTALQNAFGVQKETALAKSKYYGFDLTPLKELIPQVKNEVTPVKTETSPPESDRRLTACMRIFEKGE